MMNVRNMGYYLHVFTKSQASTVKIRLHNKLFSQTLKHLSLSVLVWPGIWVIWGQLGSWSYFQPSFSSFFLSSLMEHKHYKAPPLRSHKVTDCAQCLRATYSMMDDATVFWLTQRLNNENINFVLIALFVSLKCPTIKGQQAIGFIYFIMCQANCFAWCTPLEVLFEYAKVGVTQPANELSIRQKITSFPQNSSSRICWRLHYANCMGFMRHTGCERVWFIWFSAFASWLH